MTFSDRNDIREMNYPGRTETDSRNSQYAKISSTARNTSQQPAEQTVTNLQYIRVRMSPHESSTSAVAVCASLHWKGSSTAKCSGGSCASFSSQILQMLGKHLNFKLEVANVGTALNILNNSVKAPSFAMDRTVKSNDTHSHTSLFPRSNLMLQSGSVTTMVLP